MLGWTWYLVCVDINWGVSDPLNHISILRNISVQFVEKCTVPLPGKHTTLAYIFGSWTRKKRYLLLRWKFLLFSTRQKCAGNSRNKTSRLSASFCTKNHQNPFTSLRATVLLFNKIWDISRTAWEVEFGPRKLAGQCSWPSPKNINFGVWSYDPKISKSWSEFFFEKIFSSKIFHWISEQNIFSTNIFEREKIAKCWYFHDFFSRKCGSKKYFCSEIQWKIFEENIFSKTNSDQLFEIFGT